MIKKYLNKYKLGKNSLYFFVTKLIDTQPHSFAIIKEREKEGIV